MYTTSAKAMLLAAMASAIGGANIPNFAMPSGLDVLNAPRTSTSSTRRSRNTVAAAKRAALNAKRRKAHKARCR
jgi:hypothetical protein